jgi:glycosyltransferase involved in cell wall biosynthesis
MRFDHVVPAIDEDATGPAYSVPALCRALAELGDDVYLHALGTPPAERHPYRSRFYPRVRFLPRLGMSPLMRRGLLEAAASTNLIHSHGLWMMPNLYPAQAALAGRVPLILSPRGMMDHWAWRHHRWRKRAIWWAGQARAVRAAWCVHATAASELEYVRDLGIRAPVAVVPNGVTIPDEAAILKRPASLRTMLFLARVHRKKGVDILLHAWRNVQDRFQDWQLVIVGPDDGGWLPRMKALASDIAVRRVSFEGKVPQSEKTRYFASSELYVLPTHNENWGVSIAEALAHGVPAIVSRGAPWSGLEANRCGWWIENSVEALTETLRTALALPPEELAGRGASGRKWVQECFSWNRVAETMRLVYGWVTGTGGLPACVQT